MSCAHTKCEIPLYLHNIRPAGRMWPATAFLAAVRPFSIAENVAKVRYRIIYNRTNSGLAASF